MVQKEHLEELYRDYYPLLFAIAYRMLGSASDAEDIVQECYLRYTKASPTEISSPKSYLTTIVTLLCLDALKSARMQREQYAGVWLPEPILTRELQEPLWQTLEQHESISMAFLLLLERLTPYERAVFLLREVFAYRYQEIAEIVGKSATLYAKLPSPARGTVCLYLSVRHLPASLQCQGQAGTRLDAIHANLSRRRPGDCPGAGALMRRGENLPRSLPSG